MHEHAAAAAGEALRGHDRGHLRGLEAGEAGDRAAAEGAPNVVVVLLDDVGFGASGVFGGPVEMPTLRRIADQGLRYNQFHTTALCSPTRVALLTGRNHHSAHFGAISEIATGYPGHDSVIPKKNCSFTITAHLEVPEDGVEGVVVCQGGNMAGWSLYVKDSKPVYLYNLYGHTLTAIESSTALPAGKVELQATFDYDGGLGKGGHLVLRAGGEQVAEGRIEETVPFVFSMSGETFDVGVDTCAPVGPYEHGFPFTGTIEKVEIEVASLIDELSEEEQGQLAAGLSHAAKASQ